jgi:hypothetical protein
MKIAQSLAGPKPYFCIHFVHSLNYFIANIWMIVRALTKISKSAGNSAGPQERKPCPETVRFPGSNRSDRAGNKPAGAFGPHPTRIEKYGGSTLAEPPSVVSIRSPFAKFRLQ